MILTFTKVTEVFPATSIDNYTAILRRLPICSQFEDRSPFGPSWHGGCRHQMLSHKRADFDGGAFLLNRAFGSPALVSNRKSQRVLEHGYMLQSDDDRLQKPYFNSPLSIFILSSSFRTRVLLLSFPCVLPFARATFPGW